MTGGGAASYDGDEDSSSCGRCRSRWFFMDMASVAKDDGASGDRVSAPGNVCSLIDGGPGVFKVLLALRSFETVPALADVGPVHRGLGVVEVDHDAGDGIL